MKKSEAIKQARRLARNTNWTRVFYVVEDDSQGSTPPSDYYVATLDEMQTFYRDLEPVFSN